MTASFHVWTMQEVAFHPTQTLLEAVVFQAQVRPIRLETLPMVFRPR
jgi:hypothetical protein